MNSALVGAAIVGSVVVIGFIAMIPYRIASKADLTIKDTIKKISFTMIVPVFSGPVIFNPGRFLLPYLLFSFGVPVVMWCYCLFLAIKHRKLEEEKPV